MVARPQSLARRSVIGLLFRQHLILFGVFFVAAGLRVWGIAFGLPYRYHPDESQHVAEAARMLAGRRIEPSVFNNPPFFKYVLMVADAGWFVEQRLLAGGSTQEVINRVQVNPSALYLLARLISSLFGVTTVLMVYFLGHRGYGRKVGLLSAGLMAVAFLHVRESHFAVNDSLVTLFVAVAMLGALGIARSGRLREYVVAGTGIGLAFATKYTGAIALLPAAIGTVISFPISSGNRFKSTVRGLAVLLSISALAAALGSPYFVFQPAKVIHDVMASVYAYGSYGFEGWQIDPAGGYVYYLKTLLWGLGPGLMGLAGVGLAIALRHHSPMDWIFISVPLPYFLFMGREELFFARFMLPMLPPLMVLAAVGMLGLGRALSKLVERFRPPHKLYVVGATSVIVAMGLVPTLVSSVRFDCLLSQQDTRTLALNWINETLPSGSYLAVDWPYFGPPVFTQTDPSTGSSPTFKLLEVGGHGLADHSIEYYQEQGVNYLITTSFIERIPLADAEASQERRAFYDSLASTQEMVYHVAPRSSDKMTDFIFDEIYGPAVSLWQRDRPGPEIRIYKVMPAES